MLQLKSLNAQLRTSVSANTIWPGFFLLVFAGLFWFPNLNCSCKRRG